MIFSFVNHILKMFKILKKMIILHFINILKAVAVVQLEVLALV